MWRSTAATLGGMDAAAVYKQLGVFRSSKRLWDVMNGTAAALTDQETVTQPISQAAPSDSRRSVARVPQKPGIACGTLQGQHAAYIERQLAAFAQDMRQNDIIRQMRTIAKQLTPAEMHAIAVHYGSNGRVRTAKRC
jgi:cytochrome c553